MIKILLIDGHALAYRAFYAYPPNLNDHEGNPVNAIFGFYTLLFNTIDEINPTHLCICLDRKEKTFRHDLFEAYKSNRDAPPDQLISQLIKLKESLETMGLPHISKASFEADDLMGTLATTYANKNQKVLILTGDQDIFQLINDNISTIQPQKGNKGLSEITIEKVKEKTGVNPDQIIDLKALKGDTSDFIPGVKGIGPKTASSLLAEYQTLDQIYAHLDDIKSKSVKEKLKNDKENAYLSQKLATINCKVEIPTTLDDLKVNFKWDKIIQTFETFGFRSLIQKYASKANITIEKPKEPKIPDGTYQLIQNPEDLTDHLPHLKKGFAFDCETTSLITQDAICLGIAFSYKEKSGFYVSIHHQNHHRKALIDILKPYFEDESIPKIAHNAKYDLKILNNLNIQTQGLRFDTMIAAFLINANQKVGLKALALDLLNIEMTHFDELTEQTPLETTDLTKVTQYAAADADITLRLKNILAPRLKEKELNTLFETIEVPLIPILAKMEDIGVSIDQPYLSTLSKQFEEISKECETKIHQEAGEVFNIKSTKQLANILFKKLGLPVQKKTKTGPSTASESLEKLKDTHPIIPAIMTYRTYEKLLSTYVKALPDLVHPKTNRIHTSFNQHIVLTGRLSSTHPNLQNIPIRNEDGQKIRAAIIPAKKENFILSADYSQIELRCLAHLSNDPNMIKAFNQGEDIHQATAANIFNCPIDQVSKEQRYKAKSINFGIVYGISAFGLSQQLNISAAEAKTLIEEYYALFPTIKTYMNQIVEDTEKKGYITTYFNRRREIQDILNPNKSKQQFAKRIAINSTLQGTAADIIKKAMIVIAEKLKPYKTNMLIQVHDELVFDLHHEEFDHMPNLIKESMEQVIQFKVPLTVDVVIGKNWQET